MNKALVTSVKLQLASDKTASLARYNVTAAPCVGLSPFVNKLACLPFPLVCGL